MSIEITEYLDYMENLAAKHGDFLHTDSDRHFFRFDIEEWQDELERVNTPAIMVEAPEGEFFDNGGDGYFETLNGAFTVVVRIKDVKNYDDVHDGFDTAKGYMEDFIRRIRRDNREEHDNAIAKRFEFDANYSKMGPFKQWVGWRCTLSLTDNFDARYSESSAKFTDS